MKQTCRKSTSGHAPSKRKHIAKQAASLSGLLKKAVEDVTQDQKEPNTKAATTDPSPPASSAVLSIDMQKLTDVSAQLFLQPKEQRKSLENTAK